MVQVNKKNKILIANRGEIACRILRTLQKMQIPSLAVYSEADAKARFVLEADEAYSIGPAPALQSYLNQEAILAIAEHHQVWGIHPGYGFLSENADFAQKCKDKGIVFIGPTPEVLNTIGAKDRAKFLAQSLDIPIVPWVILPEKFEDVQKSCTQLGYPLLLKATHGGGGKGMRRVFDAENLQTLWLEAKQEALSCFGNETLLAEKYLPETRHIEVQIFGDTQGNIVHLFERDCSLQRRHQKILEQAPALGLSEKTRGSLYQAACTLAKAVQYTHAGTVEFLVTPEGDYYFMEVNPRLQVEHPVTEMICNVDLVEWQILVSQGKSLPLTQPEIHTTGHAIEVRICAEDPLTDFKAQTGKVIITQEPSISPNLRLETGLNTQDIISPYYDSMLSKIITHAPTFTEAKTNLQQALLAYRPVGLTTNLRWLRALLAYEKFNTELHLTTSLQAWMPDLEKTLAPIPRDIVHAAGLLLCITHWNHPFSGFGLYQPRTWHPNFTLEGTPYHCTIVQNGTLFEIEGQNYSLQQNSAEHWHIQNHAIIWQKDPTGWFMTCGTDLYHLELPIHDHKTDHDPQLDNLFIAPMPCIIHTVWVKEGDRLQKGDKILSFEAMKMQHTLIAPEAGHIQKIYYPPGTSVSEGTILVDFVGALDA